MIRHLYARGPHKGSSEFGLHVGKFSSGWRFLFRAHPDIGIDTVPAWLAYLCRDDVEVFDHDGVCVSLRDAIYLMMSTEDDYGKRLVSHAATRGEAGRFAHNGFDFLSSDFDQRGRTK